MDQLIGILLLGLGLKTPVTPGQVQGDITEIKNIEKDKDNKKKLFSESFGKEQDKKSSESLELKRQDAKEKFKKDRESFKAKLEDLKDEKKKQIVEHLDTKISELNTKRTNKMMEHLNKMEEILKKVNERVLEAKGKGKNTSGVDAAVIVAQEAIATARAAIEAQAGTEYVITITSEAKLAGSVGSTRQLLTNDLKSVHSLIVAARKAVVETLKELAKITGEKLSQGSPSITPTGQPTLVPTITNVPTSTTTPTPQLNQTSL